MGKWLFPPSSWWDSARACSGEPHGTCLWLQQGPSCPQASHAPLFPGYNTRQRLLFASPSCFLPATWCVFLGRLFPELEMLRLFGAPYASGSCSTLPFFPAERSELCTNSGPLDCEWVQMGFPSFSQCSFTLKSKPAYPGNRTSEQAHAVSQEIHALAMSALYKCGVICSLLPCRFAFLHPFPNGTPPPSLLPCGLCALSTLMQCFLQVWLR